jgi:hypothetical protein
MGLWQQAILPCLEETSERSPARAQAALGHNNAACFHGTFVAGILSAERGAQAPALYPGCRLIVRPIFSEADSASLQVPAATAQDLAAAVVDCIQAGARILNLSAALGHASPRDERTLQNALDYACRRGSLSLPPPVTRVQWAAQPSRAIRG